MKAVIYARVSTEMQNYDEQIYHLRAWGESRGYEVTDVYAENESAWKDGHQKELARLLHDAHRRRFQVVLVWALDRLTRGGSLAILQLVYSLHNQGVKILSYQESWTDAPGEVGEVMYSIVGWVARMESERRSERVKLGIQRVRREGKPWGRPKGSRDTKKRKVRSK